jgi:anti-sigma factor RsiW
MTCRELTDFLMAYLDGELAPRIRRQFDEHLAQCEDCRSYLDSYRRVVALGRSVGSTGEDAAEAGVPEELIQSIRHLREKAK